MVVHGQMVAIITYGCCVVVRGTSIPGTVALRIVTGIGASSGTAIWVFVWLFLPPGLCSTLYSCPFALCALGSLHFPSVTEWSDQKYFSRFQEWLMSDLPIIQKTYDLVKWSESGQNILSESGFPGFKDVQDRIFRLNQDFQDLRMYRIELNKNSRF